MILQMTNAATSVTGMPYQPPYSRVIGPSVMYCSCIAIPLPTLESSNVCCTVHVSNMLVILKCSIGLGCACLKDVVRL